MPAEHVLTATIATMNLLHHQLQLPLQDCMLPVLVVNDLARLACVCTSTRNLVMTADAASGRQLL